MLHTLWMSKAGQNEMIEKRNKYNILQSQCRFIAYIVRHINISKQTRGFYMYVHV